MMIEQPGATLPLVTIFGPPGSALSYAIRDFLYRSDVPFAWVQLMTDAQARSEAGVANLADPRLPICVFADGTRVECPTVRQITAHFGWFHTPCALNTIWPSMAPAQPASAPPSTAPPRA